MKIKFVYAFIAVVSVVFTGSLLLAESTKVSSNNEVRNLFVPVGFDNNDDVVAVVSGYADGVCFHLRQPKVDIDLPKHEIKITVVSVRVHEFCHPIAIRFNQVVHIGSLPAGSFTVETQNDTENQQLVVKPSNNSGPDDYPYAAVEAMHLVAGTNGDLSVVLRGRYTDTCQRIENVRVTPHSRTVEVMPIMKVSDRDENGKPCQAQERSFEKRIDLPKLVKGNYLLHVRSASGQSLNEVFELPFLWDGGDL